MSGSWHFIFRGKLWLWEGNDCVVVIVSCPFADVVYLTTGHRLLERYGMTEIQMGLTNPLHGDRKPVSSLGISVE